MNITFVLAVYNKLELTQECYKHLRNQYPDAPLVISSGGSSDGTSEWLQSLEDDNLSFFHDDDRLAFSETYNAGIDLVDTEKLVLIHNDMVIGEGFLEAIERLLEPNMLLSYTTIEPPIFVGHERPGKVIMDLGTGFDNFDHKKFNKYVKKNKKNDNLYDGAVFFMSGYKSMFIELGGFDGFSFVPCFCEDDDFLIRAKLKGYELKTCDSAITYHFVSQTSRFSEEMKKNRGMIEMNSNRNFVRKWGMTIGLFNQLRYQTDNEFKYTKFTMGLNLNDVNVLGYLEPFFDKISIGGDVTSYIETEQVKTRYDLKSKFGGIEDCDVVITMNVNLDEATYDSIMLLRHIIPTYGKGIYQYDNLTIEIKRDL